MEATIAVRQEILTIEGSDLDHRCHCEEAEGRRGNPFSFRPLRGRAMRCIAGDADCHVASLLAMTARGELVPLRRGVEFVQVHSAERHNGRSLRVWYILMKLSIFPLIAPSFMD